MSITKTPAPSAATLPAEPEPTPAVDRRTTTILNGPIGKGVFLVALPSVATMLLQTVNSFLDRFFVGKLGPDALAAITVSSSLMFGLMSAAMAVSVGTSALVSRFVGEGDMESAHRATRQSLLLALVLAAAVGLPMLFLNGPMLAAMGLDDVALKLASRYLHFTVLGLPALFLMVILNGAFRGLGDTVRPFWVTLAAIAVHASLNWLLIFGNAGFPRMGLPGGALALTISQAVATVAYLIFLLRSPLGPALTLPRWRFDGGWAWRIARIGLPAAGQQAVRVGSMLALQAVLARTGDHNVGTLAVAALGVGLQSEAISFMPGFGYSIAASAFVGQNLGARQVTRANAGAWSATWQGVAIMSLMGVVFFCFAEPFARLFIQHAPGESVVDKDRVEETIRLAVMYLRIAAWSQPMMAFGMILTGALQGAGETVTPTYLTLISMVILRLPLAYLLAGAAGLGPSGGFWAMSVSTIVQGILTIWAFKRGRWRTVRV